jgi:hypothetical protein
MRRSTVLSLQLLLVFPGYKVGPIVPLFLMQIVSCDLPTQLASIPLVFDQPVYGSNELTFTDFMAPGVVFTTPNGPSKLECYIATS